MAKLFVLMENATRQRGDDETKKSSCCSGKQTTRLKEIMKKLEKIAEKMINTIEENI